MQPFTCIRCGIAYNAAHLRSATIADARVCPRCQQSPATERHPLADAPPMPSQEIEAIKVKMLQTGWTYGES